MEAGRELDALVAEHIMGWRREKRHYTYVGDRIILKPPVEPEKKNVYGYRYGIHIKGLWVAHQMPEFSTNIADAWTVVERMHDLNEEQHSKWTRRLHAGLPLAELTATEAAYRICVAALATVGASAVRAAGGESDKL